MRVGGMNKRYCIPKCAAHTHTLPRKWNKYLYSQILGILAVWEISHFTLYTVLSYTHNTHISERTWMFSRGKRDNFLNEQLRIHVISFHKLSGGELWNLWSARPKLSLNASTKHVQLFRCLQNHTSSWPGFDTKR